MKRRARVSAIIVVAVAVTVGAILLEAALLSAEPVASLHATNYVNDFAGVLDSATQARLNDLCRQVDQKAHAQITVVTVKSLDGQDVVSYTVALFQQWGVGPKGKDRGVLILLATKDHKYWTTVGYGLEEILPDGKVGGFGREMVPLLRSGDFAGAVTLITARVAAVIAQDAGVTLENQPRIGAPRQRPPAPQLGAGAIVVLLLVLFFIIIPIVWAIIRGGGGPRGGSGIWSGLLWGMLLSNMGGRGGGFGGGGFGGGGGGFGGGGFGGFGGGSTGGGGAGGSW